MATEKQTCDIAINYSEIIGERVLPFMISLDLARSVIMPAPGQNQRFCYNVTGVGSKMNAEADLDYLIFGIRGDIPESLFANISVEVDGEPKQIFFGENGNVCLITAEASDPQTGYSGLKFAFPLSKAGGVMRLYYELTSPRPVGNNPVRLFGGGTSVGGLSICGPVCGRSPDSGENTSFVQSADGTPQAFAKHATCESPQSCETVGCQPAKLRVPVALTPCVRVKTPVTVCCGSPVVTSSDRPGPDNSCSFVITQKICVAVPVEISACASLGKVSVKFEDAAGEHALNDCLYGITLK